MKSIALMIAARLREKSTYTGLAALLGLVLSSTLSDTDLQTIAEVGAGVAALLTMIFRENGSPKITATELPPPAAKE